MVFRGPYCLYVCTPAFIADDLTFMVATVDDDAAPPPEVSLLDVLPTTARAWVRAVFGCVSECTSHGGSVSASGIRTFLRIVSK